jgi:rhodanese-related sulfurtransferase
MATSVKQLLEAANAAVPRITPAEAREMIAKPNTLIVDVRDAPEVEQSGKVAGAINVSRGMLEFRADPESPYHDKNFAKDKTLILYCASGGRSSLSGKVLKDLGYERVYNLGSFKDGPRAAVPSTSRSSLGDSIGHRPPCPPFRLSLPPRRRIHPLPVARSCGRRGPPRPTPPLPPSDRAPPPAVGRSCRSSRSRQSVRCRRLAP